MAGKRSHPFLASLLPGTLSGLLSAIMSVSLAAMIFNGALAEHLNVGIHLVFTSAIIVGLVMAVFSGCQPVIAMVDEDTAPIFALLAASVVASMPAGSGSEEVLLTVVGAILAATFASGLGLALLGMLRFGGLIQYLPHSVLGGYLAAVGWLLVTGGLGVSAPMLSISMTSPGSLDSAGLSHIFPAVAIALWLVLMEPRLSRTWLLPLTIIGALALWYLALSVLGIAADDPAIAGYLIGPFTTADGAALRPFLNLDAARLDWAPVFASAGSLASIFLISIFSLMLSINGLAHLHRREADMNRELMVAGFANMITSAGGGMNGLPSFSLSALAAGPDSSFNRYSGLIAVTVCLLLYLFCLNYVQFLPRSILGGILIYLGVCLIKEWLVDGYSKFNRLDYLVIPIIVLVTVFAGFLQGVLIGLVSAIVLFVVKYSSISAIRYVGSGRDFMSNVDRNAAEQEVLQRHGGELMIVALQGFLFFGTSGAVFRRISDRLETDDGTKLRYLVIDFSGVSGLDASAAINFQKIAQLAGRDGFQLLLSNLDNESLARLDPAILDHQAAGRFRQLPDLDRAIEWCEEDILASHRSRRAKESCFEQLADFLSTAEIDTLLTYLQKRDVLAGDVLTNQGEKSSELYFLETCSASAFIKTSTGRVRRVRRSNEGTVFGELGFYLEIPRTASVVIETAGVVFVLSRRALLRMEQTDPAVAAGLNRYMAHLLSERLMFTTRTLRAVSS